MGRFLAPDISAHLLTVEGEVVIDEVRKHWAATFGWHCLMALSIPLFVLMVPRGRCSGSRCSPGSRSSASERGRCTSPTWTAS
ncbi:hypothetical protein [Tessaracoccus coleopterorum]|uniref:hypothetical protein n=1 Tax=Tessaracoccus coleopterorum TaxID=2714950 RepID=UPI001E4D6F0E|nr:hypothetical protein [Tessaracoccus coleopterorum]